MPTSLLRKDCNLCILEVRSTTRSGSDSLIIYLTFVLMMGCLLVRWPSRSRGVPNNNLGGTISLLALISFCTSFFLFDGKWRRKPVPKDPWTNACPVHALFRTNDERAAILLQMNSRVWLNFIVWKNGHDIGVFGISKLL